MRNFHLLYHLCICIFFAVTTFQHGINRTLTPILIYLTLLYLVGISVEKNLCRFDVFHHQLLKQSLSWLNVNVTLRRENVKTIVRAIRTNSLVPFVTATQVDVRASFRVHPIANKMMLRKKMRISFDFSTVLLHFFCSIFFIIKKVISLI